MRFKEFLQERSDMYSISSIMIIWKEANMACFNNQLEQPKFSLEQSLKKYGRFFVDGDQDGEVLAFCDWSDQVHDQRQYPWDVHNFRPVLRFSKAINTRHALETIVVHEMVHQMLAQKHGYLKMCEIGHGPEFMSYAPTVKRYKDIELTETVEN